VTSPDSSDRRRDFLGLIRFTPNELPALCCVCGNIRTAGVRRYRYDRPLKCAACRTVTNHALVEVDPANDAREHANLRAVEDLT
jgi:hypothetical protein